MFHSAPIRTKWMAQPLSGLGLILEEELNDCHCQCYSLGKRQFDLDGKPDDIAGYRGHRYRGHRYRGQVLH